MFAILFLAAVASATPTPTVKILPVFEDPALLLIKNQLPELQILKASCAGNCFHQIVDQSVILVARSGEGYDIQFSETGLNGLTKNPTTAPFLKHLEDDSKVAIVGPVTKFPLDFFPGLSDSVVTINQYRSKLRDLIEPSIVFITGQDELTRFNEKKFYAKVADLSINQDRFSILNDYSNVARSIAFPISTVNPSTGYVYVAPLDHSVPVYTTDGLRLLSSTVPVVHSLPIVQTRSIINPLLLKGANPINI